MKFALLVMAMVSVSTFAHAQVEPVSDVEKAQTYELYCNTKSVIDKGEFAGQKLSASDVRELKEVATSFHEMLTTPKQAMENLLNSSQFGGIVLAGVCQQVVDSTDLIQKNGCLDLNGAPLKTDEGIKFCPDLIKNITPKK
jgi:hypothetical protein